MTIDPTTASCVACHDLFHPRRSDQRFCKPNCRKAHQKRNDRKTNPENSQCSPSKRRDNLVLIDTALLFAERYYLTRPSERLGYIKELVDLGRSGVQPVRSILTNGMLLRAGRDHGWLFWRRCPASHRTIAQLADEYCRQFLGCTAHAFIIGQAPEPATGELG